MIRSAPQTGYILLPVIVVITLVAAIALLMNTESALESNTAGSELDAQQAQYVAKAGMNHALWLARQQGCGIYSDLTSVSLGNDQYTTALITDLGATTNYSIPVDQDTWIASNDPTQNEGSDAKLHVRFESGESDRPLLRYDLSAIPANATILSATAWFYVTNTYPEGPVDIHASIADWLDTDATWDSMGDKIEKVVLTSIPPQPTAFVWVSANLTAQVQAWVNGQSNYGITLNSTSEGSHGQYNSTNSANAPYLEVVVGVPPSSPATLKAVGTLANDVSRTITRNDVVLYQRPRGLRLLQPDAVDGQDAEIWDQQPANNFGTAAETWVSSATSDTTRSLLRFNMGAIPAGARILQANLSLERQSGSGADQPVSAHRITNPWSEDSVSWLNRELGIFWDTAGADFDNTAVATTPVGPVDQRYAWNITPLVQGWVDGSYPNYGVALVAAVAGMSGERFYTSDDADPTRWPSLSITYACTCGQVCFAPQGSGNLLMVVINPTTLVAEDQKAKDLFESWGYTVSVISESANQAIYDALVAVNDVVFISETVNSGSVGTKLVNAPIGVVSQDGDYNPDLGLATGSTPKVGTDIDITSTDHYITRVFPIGPLPIYAASMEQLVTSGALTADQQSLTEIGGDASLVALDRGAAMEGGGNAAGRRVVLPLGTRYRFNWDHLNASGRLLVQRALEWGIGADKTSAGNLLLVVVDPAVLNAQLSAKKALIESWGYTVNLIDESDSQANFDAAAAANDVAYIPQDINSSNLGTKLRNTMIGVVNEEGEQVDELGFSADKLFKSRHEIDVVDNTHYITQPFATGLLTFTSSDQSVHMLVSSLAPGLQTLGESFNTGSLWEPSLGTLSAGDDLSAGGTAAGRRAQLPWGGGTFDINQLTDDGRTIMQRAIEWAGGAGCPGLKPLLLVVGNDSPLASKDDGMKTLIESWCYSVTVIDDGDSQANFDAAAAAADVVYVSGTTSGPTLVNKLTGSPTPIVNEINGKLDNFGFSSSTASSVTESAFSATNASHYISELFAGNPVTVFTTDLAMPVPGGTLAPDLQIVGETTGAVPALATLDTGAERWDGGFAPARRVHLPFTNADPSQLTADGETLMQRALEWAAGVGAPLPGYLDQFNDRNCDAADYTGSDGFLDWSPWSWTEVNESDGSCSGEIQIAVDPLIDDAESYRMRIENTGVRMRREVDLTVFTQPRLSFDYRLVNYPLDDFMRLRVSTNGGTDWTEIVRYTGPFDHTEYQSASFDLTAFIAADTLIQFEFNGVSTTLTSYIDNVHIQEATDEGGGGPGYTEKFQPWSAVSSDTWETVNLGAYGVPANAVVEVAVANNRTNAQRWGGVRAVGSTLDRRIQLHEAEGNGVDAITMHVQADASNQIQHYSDDTADITFVLLGYWTGASYVELFEPFTANNSNTWVEEGLADDGLGPNQVAEIAMINTNTGAERLAGVRPSGATYQRRFNLQEAESGGVDAVTMMVNTDTSTIAEVFATSAADIDFYVLGYWSTPPGTYTENGGLYGQVSTLLTWETNDLSSFGVPADSVAQFVMTNESTGAEVHIGVRESGSTLQRVLDIQEAEDGGSDAASMHVNVDGSSQVQWYSEYGSGTRDFYPVGWWVLSP